MLYFLYSIQLISQIRYLGFTYHLVVKNKNHLLNLITISYLKYYFTPKPVESWLLHVINFLSLKKTSSVYISTECIS